MHAHATHLNYLHCKQNKSNLGHGPLASCPTIYGKSSDDEQKEDTHCLIHTLSHTHAVTYTHPRYSQVSRRVCTTSTSKWSHEYTNTTDSVTNSAVNKRPPNHTCLPKLLQQSFGISAVLCQWCWDATCTAAIIAIAHVCRCIQ